VRRNLTVERFICYAVDAKNVSYKNLRDARSSWGSKVEIAGLQTKKVSLVWMLAQTILSYF
jgi:hypothetical protein